MKKIALSLSLVFTLFNFGLNTSLMAQTDNIEVVQSEDGWLLLVNDEPVMINGINWDYFPIGTNFNYSLWNESPQFIREALDNEMMLLQNMGVNVIRVYTGIPKQWIEYIYDNYGIYTMLNHAFGRFGVTIDGAWMQNTEYSDERVRELLLSEVRQLAEDFKGTRGLLMYLLGNENNYGLFWDGAETEDIPMEDRKSTIRARHMYKLLNEGALAIKSVDDRIPVAYANGDLLFLDIIVEELPDIDIFGTNTYRGMSFTDLFDRVKNEYGKPLMFTEFGSDAFNARTNQEDQVAQARYLLSNWHEIYENAAGMGKAGNSIGGFTFQFSDGWWKTGQTVELDVHNTEASWANGGYLFDFVPGENNMNEEWFGIAAKGPTTNTGHYDLYPRAAYYVLKEVHSYNPYTSDSNVNNLNRHFDGILLADAKLRARGDQGALKSEATSKISLSRFTAEFETFSTGGSLITTPDEPDPSIQRFPDELGFDHMQSFYFGFDANPAPNMRANIEFNVLGNVAENPIDEIFFENRGRPVTFVNSEGENVTVESLNRIKVYAASYNWNHDYFKLDGFFRTGHFHWAYEGDFFNLYPEANYGENIDIYNAIAPLGFELEGKKGFDGFKLAFGPELWWGANPAVLLKYSKMLGDFAVTGIFHEDIDRQGNVVSSLAIPQPKTRRLTLHVNREFGKIGIDAGGIWAGNPLNGRTFQIAREGNDGTVNVFQDRIRNRDNWGGKVKFTYSSGRFNWYAQSAVQGLVADGGADQTLTFTGWRLKDSGSGNQYNVLSGFTYLIGNFQIAPNFLWQRPIEGPVPADVDAPGRPRNIIDDPFVVRANRKTYAGELLITFDPTPATFIYEWDSDRIEDAEFAVSAGFVYRHLPTTQDAKIGFLQGGDLFAFPGAPPPKDLWEINARVVSKLNRNLGIIANLYGGNAQANGSDDRTIHRYGMDMRMIYKKTKLHTFVKFDDWGPFDFHRDFNLTFPLQLMTDISTSISNPDWFDLPATRIGIRGTWRSLNQFSPRFAPTETINGSGEFVPDPNAIGFDNGDEWEIRTYVQINI